MLWECPTCGRLYHCSLNASDCCAVRPEPIRREMTPDLIQAWKTQHGHPEKESPWTRRIAP
jgi:hypothetical protein